jgi:hypothetical protein
VQRVAAATYTLLLLYKMTVMLAPASRNPLQLPSCYSQAVSHSINGRARFQLDPSSQFT